MGVKMEQLIREKWEEIKEIMKKEYNLSPISFKTWINPLLFHKVEDNTVYIIIPADIANDIALSYISSRYKSFFQVTISEMFDDTYDVKFLLETDIKEGTSTEVKTTVPSINKVNYENTNLNPKYKFESFIVGENNKLAYNASVLVSESPGKYYNPLYLYGGSGLGKTHLMHSIGNNILNFNPDMKVLYVTSEIFTNDVIESIRSGNAASMTKLRNKYRNVDVLMIDDIQFIIGKESTQLEFFHTFNDLYNDDKHIIISSDKPPHELEILDKRFTSRFGCGLTVDIQPPDYETRMAILRSYAENSYSNMDDVIIDYIASNIKSNIRELEGAFNKVIASSKLNKVPLTLSLAEEALKDIIYPNKPKEITPTLIVNVVADHFGVKADDICSTKRNAEFVMPRQIVMYLCRELTDHSLTNIGKLLGKKDHTTVIHGIKKIEDEIKTNEELNNKIEIIKKKIIPS